MVKNLYTVWVKIDETLPWIELKGTHRTRREARRAARDALNHVEIRVVDMPERKRQLNASATAH